MPIFSFVAIFDIMAALICGSFIDQAIGWRWIEGIQGLAVTRHNISVGPRITFNEQSTSTSTRIKAPKFDRRADCMAPFLG